MKYLWKVIGIYIAFLAQSLIFENINIFSVSPDLLLAAIIICSVSLEFIPASIVGAFAGVLMDVMYGNTFGLTTLVYMYLALIVSIAVDKKNDNSPLIMSWICFISIAVMEIALAILKAMLGSSLSIAYLASSVLVKGMFAALFALLYTLLSQYIKKYTARSRNSVKEETV